MSNEVEKSIFKTIMRTSAFYALLCVVFIINVGYIEDFTIKIINIIMIIISFYLLLIITKYSKILNTNNIQ